MIFESLRLLWPGAHFKAGPWPGFITRCWDLNIRLWLLLIFVISFRKNVQNIWLLSLTLLSSNCWNYSLHVSLHVPFWSSRTFTDCRFSRRLETEWLWSSWKRYQWSWKRDVVSVLRLRNQVNSNSPYLAGTCSAVQYAWVPTDFMKWIKGAVRPRQ